MFNGRDNIIPVTGLVRKLIPSDELITKLVVPKGKYHIGDGKLLALFLIKECCKTGTLKTDDVPSYAALKKYVLSTLVQSVYKPISRHLSKRIDSWVHTVLVTIRSWTRTNANYNGGEVSISILNLKSSTTLKNPQYLIIGTPQ